MAVRRCRLADRHFEGEVLLEVLLCQVAVSHALYDAKCSAQLPRMWLPAAGLASAVWV
jgi:hypothetical protein